MRHGLCGVYYLWAQLSRQEIMSDWPLSLPLLRANGHEMTYIVSGGALNSTHSLTQLMDTGSTVNYLSGVLSGVYPKFEFLCTLN